MKAAVPRITRAAPAASASSIASPVRRPPPYCTGTPSSPRSRRRCSRLTGAPSLAPSRSTTCRSRAPASTHAARADSGILVVDRLRVEVALHEAHGVAAEDVDRRDRASPADGGVSGDADAREVGEQPQAGGGGLLGVELDAVEAAALHRGGERRHRSRRCRARPRRRRARARASARGRRRSVRAAPRGAASRIAGSAPRSSRCGAASSPAARSALHLAGDDAQPLGAAELRGGVERELHAEADAEHRRAGSQALAQELVEAELAEVAHRTRKRAHARQHQPGGGAQALGIAADAGVAPTCSSAFSTERRLPMP